MKRSLSLIFIGAALLWSGSAWSQEPDRLPFFSNQDAKAAIAGALAALPQAKCGEEPCAEATPEEFASPPVEPEDARVALMTGAKSALLKWCGLKWEERAYPLMFQEFQQRGIHNLRALTVLRLIHNGQFSRDYGNLQILKTCTDDIRDRLDKQYPKIELPPWQGAVNNALLDQSVATMVQRVLGDIEHARCGAEPCAPATEEEKKNPPVTIEQARRAMKVGLLAGAAEFCGLDWKQRIFFPFMAHERSGLNMSPRQLAIIGALHVTMQGFIVDSYKKRGQPCGEELRKNLERHLPNG